jgi:hypothetical protein
MPLILNKRCVLPVDEKDPRFFAVSRRVLKDNISVHHAYQCRDSGSRMFLKKIREEFLQFPLRVLIVLATIA